MTKPRRRATPALASLLGAAILLVGCKTTHPSILSASPSVELAAWMTGSFSSAEQAAEAPDDYFDIRLFMIPIWGERTDGPWLYVEQAAASALDQPYRQRVYHLVELPDGVRSDAYELPGNALAFAGSWQRPADFIAFGPGDLVEREGCSIYMARVGDAFEGATRADECKSALRGAAYATSEVSIRADVLTSWDRGYDADGEQVWGAVAGPYVFEKTGEL